jgi:ABC-type amino acid transport substrate-binding protein
MDVSAGLPEETYGVLGRIERNGVLRVAVDPKYPPQIYRGMNGPEGPDIRLAERIAERMGVEPSNLSRLLHGGGGVNGATFAAFLRACGFGFTIALVPFRKRRLK